jgi:spermidine synthase
VTLPSPTLPPATLARADGVLGELVLRRRAVDGADVVELVGNGVLLMDSGDASTERELAAAALGALAGTGWHVAVGGLGLGFTAAAVLADERVRRVTVVEIEPALLGWVRDGLVPSATAVLDDERAEVVVGDVADVLPRLTGLDAVLLDVDNGPGFLVSPRNAGVYGATFLGAVTGRLRPGGVLAVWSSQPSPALAAVLREVAGRCEERRLVVHRGGRDLEYVVYVARRG